MLAVGFFASETLITNSYGLNQDGEVRPYGCFFPGGNGALLAAQIAYALWIAGAHLISLFPPSVLQAQHTCGVPDKQGRAPATQP